ncbi:MAG: amidohydrolase family protein [Proteobacteria bacterium]|nr:amidohydrolase family protein [Pseudomonadota bacterium]
MGRYGHYVIDADGHGGEPRGWRRRIESRFMPQMRDYVASMREKYKTVPGAGQRANFEDGGVGAAVDDELEFDGELRAGMTDPAKRLEDMDLEGIDVAVLFPPGSGEEWALGDPAFAAALCRTLNDARAEYASHAPDRIKLVAKLPMIDPERAAEELDRCVTEHGFVGMVTATHIQQRNLDDRAFDVVWETAERHGVAVCTHGGGQAPGQVPFGIERFPTRLGVHAITHPLGAMQAVYNFTVGGILPRFPKLRVGFMEAGVGWLPFWLERLDEHWEMMPEQAPDLDRPPSEVFAAHGFLTMEPTETMVPYVLEQVSPDVICYSSDYCHWDCDFPDSVRLLAERDDLSDENKARVFASSAARLFALELPSDAGAPA